MRFSSAKMGKSLVIFVFLAFLSLCSSLVSCLPIPPASDVIDPAWPPGSILKNLGAHYGYLDIPERPPRGGGEPTQVSVLRLIALKEEANLEERLRIEDEKRREEEERRLDEEQRLFEEQQKRLEEGYRLLEQEHLDREAKFDEWEKQDYKKVWRKQVPPSKTPPPGYELQDGKWVKSVEMNAPEAGDMLKQLGYELMESVNENTETGPYLDPNSPYLQVPPPAPVEENWEMVRDWKTRKEIEDEAALEAAIQSAAIAVIAEEKQSKNPEPEVKVLTFLQKKAELYKFRKSQIRDALREWRRTRPKTYLPAIEEVSEEGSTAKATGANVIDGTKSLQQVDFATAPLFYSGPESDTESDPEYETEYETESAPDASRSRWSYAESESDLDSETDSEPDSEADSTAVPLPGSVPESVASLYTDSDAGSEASEDTNGPYDDVPLSSSLSSSIYMLSSSAASSDLSLVELSLDDTSSPGFPSSEELNNSPSSPVTSTWTEMSSDDVEATNSQQSVSSLTGEVSQEKVDGAQRTPGENALTSSHPSASSLVQETPQVEIDNAPGIPGEYSISEAGSSQSWEEVVAENLQESTAASYVISESTFDKASQRSYSPVTPQSISADEVKTDGSVSPWGGETLLFENSAWDTPEAAPGGQKEAPVFDESRLLSHPGSPTLLATLLKERLSELPSSSEWASSLVSTPRLDDGNLLSPQVPGAWPASPRIAHSQFDGVSRHAPPWSRLSESPSSSEWASMLSSLATTPQLRQGESVPVEQSSEGGASTPEMPGAWPWRSESPPLQAIPASPEAPVPVAPAVSFGRVSVVPASEGGARTPEMPGAWPWRPESPPLQALPPIPASPDAPAPIAVSVGSLASGQSTPGNAYMEAPETSVLNGKPTPESGAMTPMRMLAPEEPSKPASSFMTPLLTTGLSALGETTSRAQSLPGTPRLGLPLPVTPRLGLSLSETRSRAPSLPGTPLRALPAPGTPPPASPPRVSPPRTPSLPGTPRSELSSWPNSPAIVEADPESWPQSRINPLSVVDKDDPLPTLRKWWENKETEREWEELNAETGRNDGGSSTPAAERRQREAQAEAGKTAEGNGNGGTGFRMSTPGTEDSAGGPTYPHPDSAAWKLFGGLTSDMNEKDKKGIVMDRLGAPAKDKWGFLKWNLRNTAHGAALTRDALDVGGELVGGFLGRGRLGYFGPH